MERLQRRMREAAVVRSDTVLDVHAFLNHEVDTDLVQEIGHVFAEAYAHERITKVLTIEASGIAIAYATAVALRVPLVFARRRTALMHDAAYDMERVPAYTRGLVTDIVIAKDRLNASDRVLFIDDIIAHGDAVLGLLKVAARLGAHVVGAGIVIEKKFQSGGQKLRAQGVPCVSLVQISSLAGGQIAFADDA